MTDTSKRNIDKARDIIKYSARGYPLTVVQFAKWQDSIVEALDKCEREKDEAVREAVKQEREKIAKELKEKFIEEAGDSYISLSAMVVLFIRSLTTPQEAPQTDNT